MLFPLLKHYLDTDTALKVSQSVYCFTTSISHGVGGTGISDAIFDKYSDDDCKIMFIQNAYFYLLLLKQNK